MVRNTFKRILFKKLSANCLSANKQQRQQLKLAKEQNNKLLIFILLIKIVDHERLIYQIGPFVQSSQKEFGKSTQNWTEMSKEGNFQKKTESKPVGV